MFANLSPASSATWSSGRGPRSRSRRQRCAPESS